MKFVFIFLFAILQFRIYSQNFLNVISNEKFDIDNPLNGWDKPNILDMNSTASVHFKNGYVGFYKVTSTGWVLESILTPHFKNNLMKRDTTIERGNVLPGGGQGADFTRTIYNWLGDGYSDIWESVQDSNLFQINGGQIVNSRNTINTSNGSVNIGTKGSDGQYKLNVHGGIWLDNGRNSIILGNYAGYNDSTNFSLDIGPYAGLENKGEATILIGYLSGEKNSGMDAINIGRESGRHNFGNNLISLGSYSGFNNHGVSNILMGLGTGKNNNANHFIALGQEAGFNNKGEDCVAIGRESLFNNEGFENVGVGKNTMFFNTIGNRNTAIGADALKLNTTGNSNTMVGWRAGLNVLSTGNTFVGESASDRNTTGGYNTFIGMHTAHDNRTGSNNVALGFRSLYFLNTVTPESVTVGEQYQIHAVGTTDWVAMGAESNTQDLQFTATATGSGDGIPVSINTANGNNNTAIGFKALEGNSIGSGNVALGFEAGANNNGLSNRLYIANSNTNTPLIGGDFSTQELKIGGVQQFTVQFPTDGTGVSNGSMFYGVDGALYFKGGSGTVTQIAPN